MAALRAIFAIGVATLWLLIVAPPVFQTLPRVETGLHVDLNGAPVQRNVVRVDGNSPAYRAGIRTGDELRCLSLRDYALLIMPGLGWSSAYRAGMPISACAVRNGTQTPIRFVARTGAPIPLPYGSIALGALRIAVLLIFLVTGIALVLAKPSPMTWIFYAYCLSTAPSIGAEQLGTVLPNWAYALVVAPVNFWTSITVSFLLLFSVMVPDERVPSGWRRTAFYCALAVAAADMAFVALWIFDTAVVFNPNVYMVVDEAVTLSTVLVVVARLFTMQRAERARFGWAAFAIIFGVVTNDLRDTLAIGPLRPFSIVCADLTVVMPICLVYAILKRHVIDVRFVISRTVVYAALTTLIVGIIGLVDWSTSAYLHQVRVAMAIDAAVTIALAFALHRAYGWIEAGVDFVLFRRKHDAENYLTRMARTLLRAKNEMTIDRALVQAPYEKLDLTMAALFRPAGSTFAASDYAGWSGPDTPSLDQEHELIRFLATERTKLHIHDLRRHVAEEFRAGGPAPAVAIPLFQGDELIAFAVYGIHRDGTKLDPDEIETLERLCDIGAQAYTAIELARYRSTADAAPALERLQYQ